jgi:glycosyltransferase involved in cell wall biosynthesis
MHFLDIPSPIIGRTSPPADDKLTRPMPQRILYLTAANVVSPRVGMDLVSHEHLAELAQAPGLQVRAITVSPGIEGSPSQGLHAVCGLPVEVFVGDLKQRSGRLGRLGLTFDKLRMISTRWVPVMAYTFRSQAAARRIRAVLAAEKFDVILIDHFFTLANVRLADLARTGAKVAYISHGRLTPFVENSALQHSSWLPRLYHAMEKLRLVWAEQILFGQSGLVVHISEYERRQLASQGRPDGDRHHALLPTLSRASTGSPTKLAAQHGHRVVFLGGVGHPPNDQALDWILTRLAPALLKAAPHLQITLVGSGTDTLRPGAPANVACHGFLPTEAMEDLLSGCLCAISPVRIGGGIKIKVLDALSAGCPILATAESLRGFEPLDLPVCIELDKPEALASQLLRLSQNPEILDRLRSEMRAKWRRFTDARAGALARLVTQAAG